MRKITADLKEGERVYQYRTIDGISTLTGPYEIVKYWGTGNIGGFRVDLRDVETSIVERNIGCFNIIPEAWIHMEIFATHVQA